MSRSQRGQSLLELALVLPILFLVLAGLVEIGFFINEYIDVIDATREAARFGTSLVYTDTTLGDDIGSDDCPDEDPECGTDHGRCVPNTTHFYYVVACLAEDNLSRVEGLDMDIGQANKGIECTDCRDDIIISVFSFDRSCADECVARFPDDNGWSYTRAILMASPAQDNGPGCQFDMNGDGTVDACPTKFSIEQVESELVSSAPNAGLVLVEIVYHHYQVLNLPFFNLLPNPLRVHAYSFFPNPSAEPSATE